MISVKMNNSRVFSGNRLLTLRLYVDKLRWRGFKWYLFARMEGAARFHRLLCGEILTLYVPDEACVKEGGNDEVYMLCVKCHRRYPLTRLCENPEERLGDAKADPV